MFLKQIIRSIILRIDRFLLKLLVLPFFVIPKLKRKNIIGNNCKVMHAHNGVIAIENNTVYKIGYGKYETTKKEDNLRSIAVKKWAELENILTECKYIKISNIPILQMPLHKPINKDETLNHAIQLHKKIREFKDYSNNSVNTKDFIHMQKGLKIIKNQLKENEYDLIEGHLKNFFQNEITSIGFCHGDFHSRNIMIDNNQHLRLIDLDCISLNGIQDFDILHFILEYFWSDNGDYWCVTLKKILDNDIPKEFYELMNNFSLRTSFNLYVAYFVHRLGLEKNNYNFDIPKKMVEPVLKRISRNFM